MGRKRNQHLRTKRDGFTRKKPNDRQSWSERFLAELNGEEPEDRQENKRNNKRPTGGQAKRLNSDNL